MVDAHTQFELEATHDRAELAALFTELAGALESDRPARIAVDEGTASIAFPETIEVDLEAEADAEEVELELELEWPASASSTVLLEDAELPPDASPVDAGADETPDPASAAMPADSTTTGGDESAGDGTDAGRTARFEVYRDRAEEWRWRLVHWNGNVVADSGEGYASRYNATRAANSVSKSAATARIEQLED